MSALEEAIKKQRELYEDRGGAIHHEILATLVGAKEEVDRLARAMQTAIEWNRRNVSWSKLVEDEARAALVPFQPEKGATT